MVEQSRKSRRNLNNSSRRQEDNSFDSVDLISTLPNSIVSNILSFLPTKNAVATSVLSKRWNFMWMKVPNLDFYHERGCQYDDRVENTKFVQFVDRVLRLLDGGFLNKFRLTWNPRGVKSSPANSWINTAITRNVRELFLCVKNSISHFGMPDTFEIPISVFSCESLQSLELNGFFSLSAANVVCLPNLKSLKLVSFYSRSEEVLETLVKGCPMLNYLYVYMDIDVMLHYFGKDYVFAYLISSTSLKHLELCFQIQYHLPKAPPNCSLKLEASSLEYLRLVGFVPNIFVQKSLGSLVEVEYRIHLLEHEFSQADRCNSIVEVVRAFDCAKTLFLSADAMRALSCATMSLLAEFKRLVKLETSTYCGEYSSLRDFIESSNKLEILKIYQRLNSPDERCLSKWTTPVEVPKCISNSLKKVVIKGYYGYGDDECEMIHYILKHGSALEVMEISLNSFNSFMDCTKAKSLQEICHLPRKSPSCEVKFFE